MNRQDIRDLLANLPKAPDMTLEEIAKFKQLIDDLISDAKHTN
jgi:hypothetical protein